MIRYEVSDIERALQGHDVADFSAPFELPETIAEGQRNDVLYRYARSRKAHGDDEDAVRAALLEANRTRCQPPLEEAEVERIAAHAMAQEDRPEFAVQAAKPTQAQLLLGEAAEIELFHDLDGETAYATIRVNDHRQTWAIRSRGFRRWLVRRFYRAHGKPPTAQAVADTLGVLEARAQFDGPAQAVHVRVAGHEDKIYLDLANKRWEAVEISVDGWRIVAGPPVKFRRPRGMRPLPRPVPGGQLDELRPFVNVGSTADWHLLVAWLVAAVRPQGPYPVLALHGEQGAAKSTTAEALRRLIDPNSAPLRGEPREPRDLMITASNSWMPVYDNLGFVPPWLSDGLCRLSTGGGFATRELYSDADEVLFHAQRPVILNGIEEVVTRGDLLDRAIILYLPRITDEARRPAETFWADFDAAWPQLLGALLDVVSAALRHWPTVELASLPRMADFARWVVAAEPAPGWQPGAFLEAYRSNRAVAHELALETSPLAELLRDLARKGWQGTATQLLEVLNQRVEPDVQRSRRWPKSVSALGNALRRLAPSLRVVGATIDFVREPKKRLIILATAPETAPDPGVSAVSPVSPVSDPVESGSASDGRDDDARTADPGPSSPEPAPGGPADDDDGDDRRSPRERWGGIPPF